MFSKEQSLKLVELGKTNKTALRAFILLNSYDTPVVFSNNSLAAKLDVSASSVSIALKALKSSNLLTLYKAGTAYVCIPCEIPEEEWKKSENGDCVAELNSVIFLSCSEQDEFEETVDEVFEEETPNVE